jgi:hypothetical protein
MAMFLFKEYPPKQFDLAWNLGIGQMGQRQ